MASDKDISLNCWNPARDGDMPPNDIWQGFFDNAPIGVFRATVDGKVFSANKALASLLGYDSPQDLVTNMVPDGEEAFITAGDRDAIMADLIERGEALDRELYLTRKDGTKSWFSANIRAILAGDGSVRHVEGYTTDISLQKQVQKQLIDSENRFKLLFENAPLPYQSLNEEGYFLDVNCKWLDTLGYEKDEVIGKWFGDFLGPGFADHFDKNFPIFKHACIIDGVEFDMITKSGEAITVSFNGRVQSDEHGRFQRTHCIFSDVTEQKRDEELLREAKAAAEYANNAKDEFLATISHEIRTPLNGIMGMLQLMDTTQLDEEQTKYMDTAQRSGGNLLRLINDILDISKIEAGKLELMPEPFKVRDTVDAVLADVAVEAGSKGLDLQCQVHEDATGLYIGDASRLRQILLNLVSNAVKFTQKGSVAIHAERGRFDDPDSVLLHFRIQDTGIGIPDEALKTIFERFTQADAPKGLCMRGTGLGLSIVKMLVELMGGTVDIDSVEGKGTKVSFSVKVEELESAEELNGQQKTVRRDREGPLRILVAEDDEISRFAALRLLKHLGYEGKAAINGQEILEFLEQEEFDGILMDIQMPVMDGLEATQVIRESGMAYAHIPIVAMTAYAMDGDRERFIQFGMSEYIDKPVDMNKLKKLLQSLLGA